MKTSNELDKIGPAMAKAQAEMGGAVKDSKNPFFKSAYADLTSVWRACKDALHSNDISVIQSPIDRDGRIGVATMLLHSSGQFISDEYTLGVKKQNDPQADGSSITYARRYSLAAFVGVCPVDDDAEAGMARNAKPDFIAEDKFIDGIDYFPANKKTIASMEKWFDGKKGSLDALDAEAKKRVTSYFAQVRDVMLEDGGSK